MSISIWKGSGGGGGRGVGGEPGEGGEGVQVGDGGDEVGGEGAGKVGGGNRAADHHGLANAQTAQLDTLVDSGDAVAERAVQRECRDDVFHAETVTVALHHGDDPDAVPHMAADPCQVAADGAGVHFDPGAGAGVEVVARGRHGVFSVGR